jgi:hypothetical protein
VPWPNLRADHALLKAGYQNAVDDLRPVLLNAAKVATHVKNGDFDKAGREAGLRAIVAAVRAQKRMGCF